MCECVYVYFVDLIPYISNALNTSGDNDHTLSHSGTCYNNAPNNAITA